jgi:hypothetical protein
MSSGSKPGTLRARMYKLGMVRLEIKPRIRLSTFPQRIPQHVEVLPNTEAKRIFSCFSAFLFFACK